MQTGFFSASKDTRIMHMDLMGDPIAEFKGHEMAVNSLSQAIPEELVSGSWDGTAKIWDVETQKVKHVLPNHKHATTVLTLPNGITITGSQDKAIRLWYNGKQEKVIEDAHEDIVRGFCEVPGFGFASCSNDCVVKLWSLDGTHMLDYKGHSGFIFALMCLDSGEIVSGGDDCTVKIWKDGQCRQTIEQPRTIWALTKNSLGDIIVGSEDKKIRTFTRDHARAEKGEELKEFESEIQAKSMGGDLEMDKLPSIDQLSTTKGDQEGEIKCFKNGQ
jgi:phospholipase A-2-activating protein